LLDFEYYKAIFFLVSETSKEVFKLEKAELLSKRRQAKKENNDAEYLSIVKEMVEKEELAFTKLMGEAMEHVGCSDEDFMRSH